MDLKYVLHWKICKYQGHPLVNWKNSKVAQLSLIWNIIVQYYFCVKYIVFCVCFKIYFLIDHHCKTPRIRQKLLKFLQGVKVNFERQQKHFKKLSKYDSEAKSYLYSIWKYCQYVFVRWKATSIQIPKNTNKLPHSTSHSFLERCHPMLVMW